MSVTEKLGVIQAKLKSPKDKSNDYAKYQYRTCEDILKNVKPILAETKTVLTIEDDAILIGNKVYIKVTAKLRDCESSDCIATTAFAREAEEHKAMDASQCTGAASSYARKYALNGLFAIDNTDDADVIVAREMKESANKVAPMTPEQRAKQMYGKDYERLLNLCKQVKAKNANGGKKLREMWGKASASELETEANEWLKE